MSDLVERLRETAQAISQYEPDASTIGEQIAAHIETLQAELAEAREKVERAREALGEAADAVRAYLPPDGISEPDFIARVIAAVDSPAAFAVLQEIEP